MKLPVFLALIPLFGCDPVFAACHHMGDPAHPNACDEPVLEQATAKDSAKWTSDEKPRHNQTPAWAVDEVIVGSAKAGKENWDSVSPARKTTEAEDDAKAERKINAKNP